MSVKEDAFARGAFNEWLKETSAGICDSGNTIVWRGYALANPEYAYTMEMDADYVWYRIAIHRRFVDVRYETFIETDCSNQSMEMWMNDHHTYLKGKLIWYCRAVWDMIDNRLVSWRTFDRGEDDLDWEDAPEDLSDYEKQQRLDEYAEAKRYQDHCESRHGWDCS